MGRTFRYKANPLEIGSLYMVCPKREKDFAAVVEVMFDGAPDDPLTRKARRLLVLHLREHVVQVGRGPANESRMNHLPGGLQPTDQLAALLRGASGSGP